MEEPTATPIARSILFFIATNTAASAGARLLRKQHVLSMESQTPPVVQGRHANSNRPLRTGDVLAGIAGDGEHDETQEGRVDVERLAHGLDGPRQVPVK